MPEPSGLSGPGASEEPAATSRSEDAAPAEEVEPWNEEERTAYVRSLGVVSGPNEDAVLELLEDAISDAPLPPPWVMSRDPENGNRPCWVDMVDQESSWKHPLESSLRELAGVCHACLSLDLKARTTCLYSLKQAWEQEAKQQLNNWYRTADPADPEGREYYWHSETKEVTWGHPGEKILPTYYVKMKVLARLEEDPGATPPEADAGDAGGYSVREEMKNLDTEIRAHSPPGGQTAAPPPDLKISTAGSWWWGCSPISYLETEESDKAYGRGVGEGRQLYDERLEALQRKSLTAPEQARGAVLNDTTPEATKA